jgi:hypothetical protein
VESDAKGKTARTEQCQFAIDLNNHALLLRQLKRFDEAAGLLQRAVRIEDRYLPPDHPKRARRRNNLAIVRMLADQLDEARQLTQKPGRSRPASTMSPAAGFSSPASPSAGCGTRMQAIISANYERFWPSPNSPVRAGSTANGQQPTFSIICVPGSRRKSLTYSWPSRRPSTSRARSPILNDATSGDPRWLRR